MKIKLGELRKVIREELQRGLVSETLDIRQIGNILADLDHPMGLLSTGGTNLLNSIKQKKPITKPLLMGGIADLVGILRRNKKEKFLYPDEMNDIMVLLKSLDSQVKGSAANVN